MSILVGATSACAGAAGAAGGGADLGDTIEQSLRFRGTQHLQRNQADLSNYTANQTWSLWLKFPLSAPAANASIFNYQTNWWIFNYPSTNNYLRLDTGGTVNDFPDFICRDVSAWYHFVISNDASASTTKIWVNGELRKTINSNFATGAPSSNMIVGGQKPSGGARYFEGYMADVHFIDGQALDRTDFGKYNEDGVWVPQTYTGGNYGTNGFHLTFDSSQTNGIGHDSSGNGNHFTANGFDTTAISSSNTDNDIDYEDTPTSNYATGNRLHPHSTSSWNNANLTVDNPQDNYFRGNFQLPSSGKFYWEINNDGDGSANAQSVVYGITNPGGPNTNNLVSSPFWRNGNGFDGTAAVAVDMDAGAIWFAENNTWASGDPSAGTSPSHTDLLTAYDPVEWFPLFGGYRAVDYSINFGQMPFQYTPPTGFSALQTNNLPEPTIKNGSDHFRAIIGPGQGADANIANALLGDFASNCFFSAAGSTVDFATTAAFTSGSSRANGFDGDLTTIMSSGPANSGIVFRPDIAISATSKVEIYYAPAGNITQEIYVNSSLVDSFTSSTAGWRDISSSLTFPLTIENMAFKGTGSFAGGYVAAIRVDDEILRDGSILGLAQEAFPNGLYWIKDRANSNVWQLACSEYDVAPTTNVVRTGGANGYVAYVAPAGNSVAFCWDLTDPTVSGVEFISDTGTGVQRTVSHNLGRVPQMIWGLNMVAPASNNVYVYHSGHGPNGALNLANASGPDNRTIFWGGVDPTETEFTVGIAGTTNPVGAVYYWVFAEVPGFSAFGSYTGNNSADGVFIWTGMKPAFIVIKGINIGTGWVMFDSTRDSTNPNNALLYANATNPEISNSTVDVDFLSNGFKLRTNNSIFNGAYNYVYAAFAENPFGGENAPPATAR